MSEPIDPPTASPSLAHRVLRGLTIGVLLFLGMCVVVAPLTIIGVPLTIALAVFAVLTVAVLGGVVRLSVLALVGVAGIALSLIVLVVKLAVLATLVVAYVIAPLVVLSGGILWLWRRTRVSARARER